MSQANVEELFDEPADWRAEAVRHLGLRGEARVAAVSPGAAFPELLYVLVDHLGVGPDDLLVDVGAGLGGASAWLGGHTGATVVAVEPAWGSTVNARRLFPDLAVAAGRAAELPLRAGTARSVTLLGVLSLVEDAAPVLAECRRVLVPGGTVGIADLCSATTPRGVLHPSGSPNTFRSVDVLRAELGACGFELRHVQVADAGAETPWGEVSARVGAEVEREHSADPAYEGWVEDAEQLGRRIQDGDVEAAVVVARAG